MGHALIVDADAQAARRVADLVARTGHTAATARSLGEARRQLALQPADLVLLDRMLPGGDALDLLAEPELLGGSAVVLLDGGDTPVPAASAATRPAAGRLRKPVDARQLQRVLARLHPPTPGAAARAAPASPAPADPFDVLVGTSQCMQQVRRQLARVAPTTLPVWLVGETGTGKELAARAVHVASRRAAGPFLAMNCGAVAPQLAESELFGHERGSFTGAERQHQGWFERADGGTLFLDEITEMPLPLQVKLLRVLEDGSLWRVGATAPLRCDVRVVAAGNRDPWQAVAEGRLRADLLYRLAVMPVVLPPLRERLEDLPALVAHLLHETVQREGTPRTAGPEALAQLARHGWPGNVRELRNVLQRAWLLSDGPQLDPAWLPGA